MLATAVSDHKVPDRDPILVSVGEQVSVGARSAEWPAFVYVTSARGAGWVPSRYLSASEGEATVEKAYDTTELPLVVGDTVDVLARDDESGWWWCRSEAGEEGWVPVSVLTVLE